MKQASINFTVKWREEIQKPKTKEGHSEAGKQVQIEGNANVHRDCMRLWTCCPLFNEWFGVSVLERLYLWLSVTFSLALILIGHFQISPGLVSFSADCTDLEIQCGSDEEVKIETSGSGWFRWTDGSTRLSCGELLFPWRKSVFGFGFAFISVKWRR